MESRRLAALGVLLVIVVVAGSFLVGLLIAPSPDRTPVVSQDQHTSVAPDTVAAAERERAAFIDAERRNTVEAYRQFSAAYPASPQLAEAMKRAEAIGGDAAGQAITAALAAGKIEAEVTGNGIDQVSLRARNRTGHQLRVVIPVGTYFICRGSAQNMVSRCEAVLDLPHDQWQTATVSTACANMHRDVPEAESKFRIAAAPNSAELKRAMAQVPPGLDYETVQALVWILTDNANYDDLGTLIGGYGGRLIGENEAVRALQLIDAAGISITRKRIWRDRQMLLNGLTDEGLKQWWQQKLGR